MQVFLDKLGLKQADVIDRSWYVWQTLLIALVGLAPAVYSYFAGVLACNIRQ